jgi:hypothetical protein
MELRGRETLNKAVFKESKFRQAMPTKKAAAFPGPSQMICSAYLMQFKSHLRRFSVWFIIRIIERMIPKTKVSPVAIDGQISFAISRYGFLTCPSEWKRSRKIITAL